MGFLHHFHLCRLHVYLSRRPQGELTSMADTNVCPAPPPSLIARGTLGASVYPLYALQTLPCWQGGKCLLPCFLVPSALRHQPRNCWVSLAQGSGDSKPGDAVLQLWHGLAPKVMAG